MTFTGEDIELIALSLEVWLKWTNDLRRDTASEHSSLAVLLQAERIENQIIVTLEAITKHMGVLPELTRLVDMIPDRELRRQSRRAALIKAWQDYQAGSWIEETLGVKHLQTSRMFGGSSSVTNHASWLPFERNRTDRYMDKLVRLVLDQLDHGLPENTESPQFQQGIELWEDAMLHNVRFDDTASFRFAFTQSWTEDNEQRIEDLLAKYADVDAK